MQAKACTRGPARPARDTPGPAARQLGSSGASVPRGGGRSPGPRGEPSAAPSIERHLFLASSSVNYLVIWYMTPAETTMPPGSSQPEAPSPGRPALEAAECGGAAPGTQREALGVRGRRAPPGRTCRQGTGLQTRSLHAFTAASNEDKPEDANDTPTRSSETPRCS